MTANPCPSLTETLASAQRMLDAAARPGADDSPELLKTATALRDSAARAAGAASLPPAIRATFLRQLEEFDRRRFATAKRLLAGSDDAS